MQGRPDADVLTNPRSERVRSVRRLAGRPSRVRAGLFLAEGPQAVREAVRPGPSGTVAAREVYGTVEALARHEDVVADALAAGTVVRPCTAEVLAEMADTVTPQGLVAVCRPVDVPLATALARRPALVAVLAEVRDPGNAGAVLRAADAAGAGAVVLSAGSVDVHNPKCVRSTAGSLFHVDVVVGADLGETVASLRACGAAVLAADGDGPADLDDLADEAERRTGPLAGPVAWLFGTEAQGLSAEQRALADAVVRVPIHGRAESLNLATAATVCLYAAARAHRRLRADAGPRAAGSVGAP
ncbi:TrmH family RNA methyltransferase [Pseudokineococcus basanitobsidens]|uniref:TrmH family RNA methyltransferase n=1 Tax=Pseudokineococcus basanitobsidens TaxID=1926649 RepID=UPI003BB4B819